MRWAMVNTETNNVLNVIIWDGSAGEFASQPNVSLVLLEEDEFCGIDYSYDENSIPRFTPPPYVPPTISWTAYEFLNRFTYQERAAYRSAASTDDLVADFMSLAQAAQEVVNTDPMTVAGMNYLVTIGLLTEQRKNEILGYA
jgi:hypothetical protein